MSLALKGLKVIDASQMIAAPMAARHLADFGADVVHLEPPLTGDNWRPSRGFPPFAPASDINYNFESFNRNKRGLTLDLAQEDGKIILGKLLEEADVFLTNMRPGEQERFQVDYETLHRRHPRLIHASVSGAGLKGPERDLPGYDVTGLLYRSGMQYALGSGLGPEGGMKWRIGQGDTVAALGLFAAIMTALYVREQTGFGQQVDLSLFGIGVYQMCFDVAGFMASGTDFRELAINVAEEEADTPKGRRRARLTAKADEAVTKLCEFRRKDTKAPYAMAFRTGDGRRLILNAISPERHHAGICRAIGREDLIDDPRFASYELLMANAYDIFCVLRDAILTKSLDEWREPFNREGLPWAAEQSFRDVYNDPQAKANNFFVPFDHPEHGPIEVIANPLNLSETPSSVRLPAPEFSQHTEEILLETGYSWEDIAAFKEKGVIA